MTPIGWRIYYADGSVVSSKDISWEKAPSDKVEVVTLYFQETYQIWHGDHQDTENYCHLFHGQDYYWVHDGQIGAGNVQQVPSDLLDGELKVGLELNDTDFVRIYNQAKEQRVF